MRVIDPGHKYALRHLDGPGEEIVTYVKREGEKYPGNVGHHAGTTLQEQWRAQIHRLLYLNEQDEHWANHAAIDALRDCIEALEKRASERHRRVLNLNPSRWIEDESVCGMCGHIGCTGSCAPPAQPPTEGK